MTGGRGEKERAKEKEVKKKRKKDQKCITLAAALKKVSEE
jgi:hypothetical protein